ncbi:MAG: oligosaccharide flippase family protein [Clostridiales bacterium]|nr:oligosaccharide flippase family protein [Clostridiales bacterium]
MSSNIRLLKNSSLYSIVQILQKCIGLFLLPLYTSILEPSDKGISDIVATIVSVLSVFYTFAIASSVIRFYTDYKNDEKKLSEFWGTCVTFVLLNGIFMTIVLTLTKNYILIPITNYEVAFFPYIFVGLISITLNPVYTIFQSTLQAKEDSRKYAANNFCYFIVNLILNILFVAVFRLGGLGVLLALAITDAAFFIYTIIVFFPKVKLGINRVYLKEALKYSLPLLPHSLSGWVISMIDRVFINIYNGLGNTAIYTTAASFGNIINVITSAINQAYVPWFFDKMKNKKKNELDIVKISEYLTIFYGFLAMGMSLFAPEVFKILVRKDYVTGWTIIPALSFAYVFNGIYYFFVNPLFYNKRGVKYISIGTFTAAILNSVLNIGFIQLWGGNGAALASMVSNIIACILIYFISKRIEPIKFNMMKMFCIAFSFYGISLLTYVLSGYSFFIAILIKILIVLLVIGILALIYRSESKELIKTAKTYINNRKK